MPSQIASDCCAVWNMRVDFYRLLSHYNRRSGMGPGMFSVWVCSKCVWIDVKSMSPSTFHCWFRFQWLESTCCSLGSVLNWCWLVLLWHLLAKFNANRISTILLLFCVKKIDQFVGEMWSRSMAVTGLVNDRIIVFGQLPVTRCGCRAKRSRLAIGIEDIGILLLAPQPWLASRRKSTKNKPFIFRSI